MGLTAVHTPPWQLGWLTPPVVMIVALAFYGLDSVGAELEGPFGVDENDMPLLLDGAKLCNDLDALLRSAHRTRVRARTALQPAEERAAAEAAADELAWPMRSDLRGSSPPRAASMRGSAPGELAA